MSNKKKVFVLILAFIFCAIASAAIPSFLLTNYYNKEIKESKTKWQKVRVADPILYSDNGYIDYANEVYLDDETYPDLKEMGMFWAKWDDANEKVILHDADSDEGAKLVDADKPTIIFIHGMLLDGHYQQEMFYLSPRATDTTEFNITTERVSLIHLWILEGWNVGVFHYNRFASEPMPTPIEAKIWANDGPEKVRIRHEDDTTSHVTEYSVAEHFAAEYLRAMNLLPQKMGKKEIRIAAHSMGGELMTAGIFLLTELASDGQLDYRHLPNRFSMLDPYFCVNLMIDGKLNYLGPSGITVRWTGKGLYKDNTGYTMIECLKDFVANGIAIDYYTHKESTLHLGMPDDIKSELKRLSTFSMINPNYASYGKGYNVIAHGHNGVRDWYYCSIRGDLAKYEGANTIFNVAPTAKTPTDVIRAQKGMSFRMTTGYSTVHSNDDIFVDFN